MLDFFFRTLLIFQGKLLDHSRETSTIAITSAKLYTFLVENKKRKNTTLLGKTLQI